MQKSSISQKTVTISIDGKLLSSKFILSKSILLEISSFPSFLSRTDVKIARVYEAQNQTEEAQAKYSEAAKAAKLLEWGGSMSTHQLKILGDINRNDEATAAKYYSNALSLLRQVKAQVAALQNQNIENFPPFLKLSSEFYKEEAEVLESLASLHGTENATALKAEAQEARKLAEKAKEEEQKPPC